MAAMQAIKEDDENKAPQEPRKISIIGSGTMGSTIARLLGESVQSQADLFHPNIVVWVKEEEVDGQPLSEIINKQHKNPKYLPGFDFPPNVIAVPKLTKAVMDADILIFVIPHQYVRAVCDKIKEHMKPTAVALSLIKGLSNSLEGIELVSNVISEKLEIPCWVLMGATRAVEVARGFFAEATIGCADEEMGVILKRLFQTPSFRIVVVPDANTVEVCGSLKNIVGCAAGFVEGLGMGDNTKAAVIRLGMVEMTEFIDYFFPGANLSTFFESCGLADLIIPCYGGRNKKICQAMVQTGRKLEDLEREMGSSLLMDGPMRGPHTAAQVYRVLEAEELTHKFPIFVSVHKICQGEIHASEMLDNLRKDDEEKQRNANHRSSVRKLSVVLGTWGLRLRPLKTRSLTPPPESTQEIPAERWKPQRQYTVAF